MIKNEINHEEVIQKFLEKQRERIKKLSTRCNGRKKKNGVKKK